MNQPMRFLKSLFPGLLRSNQQILLMSGVTLTGLVGLASNGTLLAQTVDGGEASLSVEVAPVDPAPYAVPAEPEPYIPAPMPEVAPIAPAPLNEAYIDSTGYDVGATYRTPEAIVPSRIDRQSLPPAPAIGYGASSPSSPSLSSISPVANYDVGTTPSLKDFYRRTLRPPGRLGNGNIRLIFPLSIPAPITSLFGWRIHPLAGVPRFHSGTDIGAPLGTPVLAAYAGQVALADFLGGYGLTVALDHNQGKQQTLYAHLSEVFVQAGELVKQGTVIGRVGSTGSSTGPHLHFEYRELTSEGWVALDAGSQLEYALADLVKVMEVAEKGLGVVNNLQISQRGQAGISGAIAWNAALITRDRNAQQGQD